MLDLRWPLFAGPAGCSAAPASISGSGASIVRCRCCSASLLVSLFIWFAENIGTFTKTWLYPSQRHGWSMVSIDKLGSWFLLLIISYTLVSLINAPRQRRGSSLRRAASRSRARAPVRCHLQRVEMRLRRRRRTRTGLATSLLLAGQNALPQRGDAALRLRRDQAVALIVEAAEFG